MPESYELLKNKNIYSILDGDENYGFFSTESGLKIRVSLPYLSGSDLCSLLTQFGKPTEYRWGGGALSRWQYVEMLIEQCLKMKRCPDLLSYLFSKEQFSILFRGLSSNEIEILYPKIVMTILDKINGILSLSGHELINLGNQFYIKKKEENVSIEAPKIKGIDRSYIKNVSEKAFQDIEQNHFDSAITKSRTLLEEVFCYVLEQKNVKPTSDGDIMKLYKQAREIYNMHFQKEGDTRINKLLSGLNNIVDALSEIRNICGDAHGVGTRRLNIDDYHARLCVNAAITMADFILSVQKKSEVIQSSDL